MKLKINEIYNIECRKGFKLLDENSIDLIITSPPYNVGIDYDNWDDEMLWEEYVKFTKEWLTEAYRTLKPDGRIAVNIPYEINICNRGGRILVVAEYHQLMKEIGFKFAGIVDLEEDNPHRIKLTAWGSWLSPSAPYIYNPKECVVLYYKEQWKKQNKGKAYFANGTEELKREFMELTSGIWHYRAETKKWTQANFSLDIPLKALKILSYEGDLVLDPFMGSGTTAVACIMLNRHYIGFEISEEYCKIAQQRINNALQQKILFLQT